MEKELREIVKDLREMKIWGRADITGPVRDGFNHIADRIEAALAEKPAERPASVQGSGEPPAGENWWTPAALDVIRFARAHAPVDWHNAIVNGLLRAYNRGVDAARAQGEEKP